MTLELTESQINGRFRIYDKPKASPGKCSVCGSVERSVVDFGLDVDFYGAVVFCVECLRSAAELLDMVPGHLLRTAQLVQRAHVEEIMSAGALVNEYTKRAADLNDEFTTRLSNVIGSHVGENDDNDESTDTVTVAFVPASDDGPDELVEQGNFFAIDERPASVSGDSSDGKPGQFSV